MKTNKYITVSFIVLLILGAAIFLVSTFCIDRPSKNNNNNETDIIFSMIKNPESPGAFETLEKDNVQFLIARGDIGKPGGTIYASTIGQGPKTFNPWVSKDATSSEMGNLMFDSLLTTDAFSGEVIPKMALSYDVSDDQTEYKITLRKGLIWSDGKPITTKDIKFTWDEIISKGLGNASTRDNLLVEGKMPELKIIDKYNMVFKTSKPFAPFLRQMGGIPIAPKHILKPVVDKGEQFFDSFWGPDASPESFITSGMFKLKNYFAGQRVEFVKNPNYYMVDKEGTALPYIDKYVIYIVGSLDTDIMKFKANELDLISVPGNQVVTIKEEEMKPNSNFKLYNLGPTTTTTFIVFNMNNRINKKTGKPYVATKLQKWFQDPYFRKAVEWAIDRKNIVNNVVQGVGAPLFTAEGLPSIFLNKNLAKGHPRDVNKAKEFLKEGGFYLKNNILYDKDNQRVEFNLLTNAGNTEREAIGVIIKEDLEQLGMKVNFKPIEFNALVNKLTGSLDWEAVIIGLTGSALEPHGGRNVWSSDGSLHMFNQRNPDIDQEGSDKVIDFEKRLDELFEEGASSIDFETRKKVYDEYQQVIYDNNPMIYLYSPLNIYAVRNRLGNIKPTILGGIQHNLEEIYIKDNQ